MSTEAHPAEGDYSETEKYQTSQFDLCKWYKTHRDTVVAWLKEYSPASAHVVVKGFQMHVSSSSEETLKPQSEEEAQVKKSFAADVSGDQGSSRMIFPGNISLGWNGICILGCTSMGISQTDPE